ncbi:MAG TPA: hypothetical protein VH092_23490, partial [Urbifossiella sp.]|nr:hypothetical protein [Urbifossiella sp.]
PTPEPKKTTSDPKKTPDPKTTTPDPKTTPEPKKTPDPKATIPEPKKTPDPKTTTPEPKKTEPMPPAKVDEAKKGGPAGGPVVRGVLTLKGLPVANADLMFVSLDRPAPVVVTAKTNADGTYSTNLVAGRYAVTVVAAGKGAVPARYATTDTSGLTVVVSAGSNAFDIALQ